MALVQYDTSNLIIGEYRIQKGELLTLAAADVLLKGTILARDTTTLKLVLYVKGGTTAGNGIPKRVLPYDLTVAAGGDVAVNVIKTGELDLNETVIDADGDASNITIDVQDQLLDFGIILTDVTQQSVLSVTS